MVGLDGLAVEINASAVLDGDAPFEQRVREGRSSVVGEGAKERIERYRVGADPVIVCVRNAGREGVCAETILADQVVPKRDYAGTGKGYVNTVSISG